MIALPPPLSAYFEANARLDAAAMLAPFASDAVVHDERRTHTGRAEIGAWIEQATIAASAVATPLSASEQGESVVVRAEVSGQFPGSPITLDFRFTLAGGRIAGLAIG